MGKFSLFKLKLLSIRRGVETESITSLVNNFSPNFTLSDLHRFTTFPHSQFTGFKNLIQPR